MVSVGFSSLSRQVEYDVEVFTLILNLVLILLLHVHGWKNRCAALGISLQESQV
jgi:hypothetical protein